MKNLLLAAAATAGFLVSGQTAFAQPELFLKTGATSMVVVGSGNTVTFNSADFGGWDVQIAFGSSNSPTDVPFGLDITGLMVCDTASCATTPLDVWLSDTGFTTAVAGFDNSYSGTLTGAGITRQITWVGLGNILFEGNGADGPPTVPGGPLISVISLTGTGGSSSTGGPPAGPAPYSLTIEDIFNANGGSATFSVDGDVSAIPEPGTWAMMLLGFAGLGYAWLRRARRERMSRSMA